MSTVSRTFDVAAPSAIVVPYLADFSHAVEWDPGTQSCERTDSGPIRVGSTWHNTSRIAGISTDLTYTLEQLEDNHIVLVGRNDTATSTETIDVRDHGTGATITYTNELHFNGAAKLVTPLARVIFEKLGNDTEKQLVKALNALVA